MQNECLFTQSGSAHIVHSQADGRIAMKCDDMQSQTRF